MEDELLLQSLFDLKLACLEFGNTTGAKIVNQKILEIISGKN